MVGEIDRGADDEGLVVLSCHAGHERSIDLELGHREICQVCK